MPWRRNFIVRICSNVKPYVNKIHTIWSGILNAVFFPEFAQHNIRDKKQIDKRRVIGALVQLWHLDYGILR